MMDAGAGGMPQLGSESTAFEATAIEDGPTAVVRGSDGWPVGSP
jgi:hypothetical protein